MGSPSDSGSGERIVVSSGLCKSDSLEAVRLVHAFLHTNAKPKLAAKLADQYPNLALADDLERADDLSNALVSTIKSALAVSNSDLSRALEGKKKKARKSESKEEKKAKKARKSAAAQATEEPMPAGPEKEVSMAIDPPVAQSEEPPQVTQSTTVEPNQVTVTKTTQSSAPSNKKGKPTGERFQRVKSDQAVYMDDRLRDMSYAAKSGAGDYGARANADLIVTQGKAFTKEKNKKKRGSYRGGVIDQGSQ